jgi:cell division protein FtsZ
MNTPPENTGGAPWDTTNPVALKKKISIKVCGVGGAGCNAAGFIAQTKFDGVDFLLLNTDAQALAASPFPNKWVLGQKRTRGLGTGGDPEQGRAAAEDDAAQLASFCAGADILFILAGLGGGTGTGAAPVLARVARQSGALVLAMATLPFDFEGGRRRRQADAGLRQLKADADAVICLPNQKLLKLLDENTSVLETFVIGHTLMADGLRGVWRLLTQTGLINVDFADLCSVTRGRHDAGSFATAEAGGEKRGEQIIEKLLAHPLLDGGQVLNQSDAVLVSLAGGPDLTMSEVNKIMEPLQRQCENAHLIFGAVIDEAFSGRLSVTLIASSRPAAEAAPLSGDPSAAALAPAQAPAAADPAAMQFLDPSATPRPPSRFVAPPPEMSNEKKEQLYSRQTGQPRRKSARLQKELPLEIVFKGRFDKSEPTIRHGEDLDLPTYIRKGVALN